jgi:arylsulfatase A-like enzyme
VLLLVADTLRADRLGAYGNSRGLTPFLDALANRSYVFRDAYAQSPWTSPSIASLLTSRYPSQHGFVRFESLLSGEELTLAEVLGERGFATAGFTANTLLSRKRGFSQGFDSYRVLATPAARPRHRLVSWVTARADAIGDAALAWLEGTARPGRPVLLYLHYMDTHTPYEPAAPALEKLFAGRPPPDLEALTDAHLFGRMGGLDAQTLAAVKDVYDAEVLSLDLALGRFFAELERRGFLRNAVVIFTADHGEEFMDHGFTGHGHSLFDELIHVPLLVSLPGQSQRVDVTGAVSLVDLAPTLVELAGGAPPASFEGRSFASLLGGLGEPRQQRLPEAAAVSEMAVVNGIRLTPHARAVMLGSRKLITGVGGESEFYDRSLDPGESDPGGVEVQDRERLQRALESFAKHASQSAGQGRSQPLDSTDQEQLRALGYLE